MEWLDDELTMERLDELMKSLNTSLIPFLDNLHDFEGDNPNYFLLYIIGKLAIYYEKEKIENDNFKECLLASLSAVADDPHTQQFVSQFVGDKVHEGLTGYE